MPAMANNVTKIERLGLESDVVRLVNSGITKATAICEALAPRLEDLGEKLTPEAVRSYLRKVRIESQDSAKTIFAKHISDTLPTDLQTLESVQGALFSWFKEAPGARAQRLAEKFSQSDEIVRAFAHMLSGFAAKSADEQRVTVKEIMGACLAIVAEDEAVQKHKMSLARTLMDVLGIKLGKGKELDRESQGDIIIVRRDDEAGPEEPGRKDGGRERLEFSFGDEEGADYGLQ